MIKKGEVVRKLVHISSVFLIFIDAYYHPLAVALLFLSGFAYLLEEFERRRGRRLPLLTKFVSYCSYPFERNSLILPPLLFTFSIGFILLYFESKVAYVAIVASTLGDVSAWFFGKSFGKVRLPYNRNKTLEGALAFFFTTLSASLLFVNFTKVFLVSVVASLVESASEKVDNVTVPFSVVFVLELL